MVWAAVLVAFTASSVVSWVMLVFGRRSGVVDLPDDDLKTHTGSPVPLGGVALFAGLHIGLSVAGSFDLGLFLATLLVLAVGVLDDIRDLSPVSRILSASVAGVILVLGSSVVEGFVPSVAAVGLVLVGVNAVNLIDGLDALASSISSLALCGLAVFGVVLGIAQPWTPLVVAGAVAGVLLFNWPPARLYLGDNGAYVIGVALAWTVLRGASDWVVGIVGVALIGVPLVDLVLTVIRRLKGGQRISSGDRLHLYDRLAHRLDSDISAVAVLALTQVVWSGLIITALWVGGTGVAFGVAVALGLFVLVLGWATA